MDAVIEQNPYLDGQFFAPVRDEAVLAPEALRVEGTIPRDQASGQGERWLFDARSIAAGPLAKIHIPQRLPTGFHGIWVPQSYPGGR